jgi:hypothetical protein
VEYYKQKTKKLREERRDTKGILFIKRDNQAVPNISQIEFGAAEKLSKFDKKK